MFKSIKSQIFISMSVVIIVVLVASAYFVIDQKTKEITDDISKGALNYAELAYEPIVNNYESNYQNNDYTHFNLEMINIYNLSAEISAMSLIDKNGNILYQSSRKPFEELSVGHSREEIEIMLAQNNEEYIPPEEIPEDSSLQPQDSENPDLPPEEIERQKEIKKLQKKLASKNFGGTNLHAAATKLSSNNIERNQSNKISIETTKDRVVYIDRSQGEAKYTDFNGKKVNPLSTSDKIKNIILPFRSNAENEIKSFSMYYEVDYSSLNERVEKTRNNMIIIALFGIAIALFMGNILANKITSPIKILTDGALKIGAGKLSTRINVNSKSEIGQLSTTFNKMAQDLDKSTKEIVEKEKLTHELELAGDIQRELLPTEPPKIKNLDIAASLSSADAIGGDCYDFLQINKDNLIFYVGDVTGHGVPAGLVAAINNALVPAFMEHYQNTEELIIHLNKLLKEKTKANVFMTMVMTHWHVKQAKLGFTQAGHNPIIHFDKKKKTVKEMQAGGMALGMVKDISKIIKTDYINMQIGDIAVLYTDGITEAWKNDKENYGIERFKKSILKNSELKTAQAIHDGILKDVRDFMGSYPQADDITLLVVRRTC